jgi:hypothetical protein
MGFRDTMDQEICSPSSYQIYPPPSYRSSQNTPSGTPRREKHAAVVEKIIPTVSESITSSKIYLTSEKIQVEANKKWLQYSYEEYTWWRITIKLLFISIILTGVFWGLFDNQLDNIGSVNAVITNFSNVKRDSYITVYFFYLQDRNMTYIGSSTDDYDAEELITIQYTRPIGNTIPIFYQKDDPYTSFMTQYKAKMGVNSTFYVLGIISTILMIILLFLVICAMPLCIDTYHFRKDICRWYLKKNPNIIYRKNKYGLNFF